MVGMQVKTPCIGVCGLGCGLLLIEWTPTSEEALDEIPEYSVLIIDGSESNFIDYDILEIVKEYHNKAHDKHIKLHLKGIEKVNITAVHWQMRKAADYSGFKKLGVQWLIEHSTSH